MGRARARGCGDAYAAVPTRQRQQDFFGCTLAGERADLVPTAAWSPTTHRARRDRVCRHAARRARSGAWRTRANTSLSNRPHFGPGATVGGCVTASLSGPRRAKCRRVRDFMLGVKLLDGRGEVLRFGGQVMKNVAGYDVSRLVAGSLGTLGILLEVSLKVLPRPGGRGRCVRARRGQRAAAHVNEWGGQPLPVSATLWQRGVLHLRLSGAGGGGAGGLCAARRRSAR